MALMTATGPPPNFLMPLVTGFPLLVGLRALDPRRGARRALDAGRRGVSSAGWRCGTRRSRSRRSWGWRAGLALAGLRPRPRAGLAFGAWLAVGASPLLLARLIGASGAKVVTASSAVTALRPRWLWGEGVSDLAHALRGLTGLQVPLVVDGAERAELPAALVVLLAVGLLVALGAGLWSRRALPLLGWAGALAGAFWLSRRTGPDELRYLYGLNAPAPGARRGRARAALGVASPDGPRPRPGGASSVGVGDPARRRAVVGPGPRRERLAGAAARARRSRSWSGEGIRSAYASLQFAGRLTLESEGTVIASQAWNERIPGDPLRFRDEVDLDPAPAWVLSPGSLPRDAARRGVP